MSAKSIAMVLAVALLLLLGARNEWRIDLDTGEQAYERSIWGYSISVMSEYGYLECGGAWTNPLPEVSGIQILSSCSLLGCERSTVSTDVIVKGCKTR